MPIDDRITTLVLQEFRLQAADTSGAVASIVASSPRGSEPPVPLLTSIDDRRHVATLRALRADESSEPDAAQHAALAPFVSSWTPPKHFVPRIAERSESPPDHYRLAVTESGINNAEMDAASSALLSPMPEGAYTSLGLLWIGEPVGTHAGLLVLLGSHDDPSTTSLDPDWPLSLSRDLGVRIYESRSDMALLAH